MFLLLPFAPGTRSGVLPPGKSLLITAAVGWEHGSAPTLQDFPLESEFPHPISENILRPIILQRGIWSEREFKPQILEIATGDKAVALYLFSACSFSLGKV